MHDIVRCVAYIKTCKNNTFQSFIRRGNKLVSSILIIDLQKQGRHVWHYGFNFNEHGQAW